MAGFFHLLMAYIKIWAQLCMNYAQIAFKIYFYFTSSNVIIYEYQLVTLAWYKYVV